jgi:transposase
MARAAALASAGRGVANPRRRERPDGKAKPKRSPRACRRAAPLPAKLKRVEVPNPVPPDLRICPNCGAEMRTIGHSRCEMLDVEPAKVFVRVRVDETVACPKDDTIVSASTPPAIVKRGKLGDTLIVEATCDEYLEHMPIERQCSRFEKYGVESAPQTLRRSVSAHLDLLMPIARLIAQQTRGPGLRRAAIRTASSASSARATSHAPYNVTARA